MEDIETILVRKLRIRLADTVYCKVKTASGEEVDEPQHIFEEEKLISFIEESISAFNCIPPFTYNTLRDYEFCDTHSALLIQYAVYAALFSQSLKERERQYIFINVSDVRPSYLSNFLLNAANHEFEKWIRLVKEVKQGDYNMEPFGSRYYEHWVAEPEGKNE